MSSPPASSPVLAPPPLERAHLVDSTVWSRVRPHANLAEWFNAQVRARRILTCEVVNLELLRSARNADAFRRQAALLALLGRCPVGEEQYLRARAVQDRLAGKGRHRGVPPTDYLIAAAGEAAGVPVLHYDHDFDLIAEASGQECHWFVPAGSLP